MTLSSYCLSRKKRKRFWGRPPPPIRVWDWEFHLLWAHFRMSMCLCAKVRKNGQIIDAKLKFWLFIYFFYLRLAILLFIVTIYNLETTYECSILCQLIPVNVGKLSGGVRVFIHSNESKMVKTNNLPVKRCVHAKFAFIKVLEAPLIGGGKKTSPVKPRRPCT